MTISYTTPERDKYVLFCDCKGRSILSIYFVMNINRICVGCRNSAVQSITIIHTTLRWQGQNNESDFNLATDTPYPALTDDLWGVL